MLTQSDLEARGWTFDAMNGQGWVGDELRLQVVSDIPLFALIRAAGHLEGDDELMDDQLTAELVQQVSGETWTPPPPPPPAIATAVDHADASAALITEKLAAVPITVDQLPAILTTLLGEAASGIPFFEKYALDPSMTSQQWAAFQALDQTTKDRLLYDALRTIAALLRYLSGDLPTS